MEITENIVLHKNAENSSDGTHKHRKILNEKGNKTGTYDQNQKAIAENTWMHNYVGGLEQFGNHRTYSE